MSKRITYTNETGQNFFTQRRNQLENAQSEHYPKVMALFSELIQNSDDAKSSELILGFTGEGLYISNNGKSFNMGAMRDNRGQSVGGDLESLSLIGERKKSGFEDSTTGTHGTGFELIYYISNQFEVHWFDLPDGNDESGFTSCRSQPDQLAMGRSTWEWAETGDEEWIITPLYASESETKRGVTFRAPWRNSKDKKWTPNSDSKYQPFNESESFMSWDSESIHQLFVQCQYYMPFMFQFCKNLKTIEMYEILDEKKEVNVSKIERTKGYDNEEYGLGSGRQGSELVNHQIQTSTFKPTQANWNHCQKENPKSPQFELIRSLKFDSDVFKKLKLVDNKSLDFLHSWGPVYRSTETRLGRDPLDRGLKISCWHRKGDLNKIHICEIDLQGDPEFCRDGRYECVRIRSPGEWKQVRWQIVHLNLPLFDTESYFENFRAPNKTFISSVMPLAMLTNNRFFVSGDFHVQENRKQFKSQPEEASEWNKSVAGSIFELLIDTFSQLEDGISDEDSNLKKFGSINLLPERLANWFSDLTSLEPFIRGQNWDNCEKSLLDSIWNSEWVISTDGSLIRPSEAFIPLEEDGTYSSSLSETLVHLGLKVASEDFCRNIADSSEVMDSMKQKFLHNTPYGGLDLRLQNQFVESLEGFNPENFTSIRTKMAVHLARLSEKYADSFNAEKLPKTYLDDNNNYVQKSDFVKIQKHWAFFKDIYPHLRTPHADISGLIKIEELNTGLALTLFSKIEHDLKDSKKLLQCVKFANQVLEDEKFAIEKRKIDFIPVQYQGEWVLRPDNHLKVCQKCGMAIKHVDSFEDDSKNFGCCLAPIEYKHPTSLVSGRKDLDAASRQFIYNSHKEQSELPEIIRHNMYIAHKSIVNSQNIVLNADKRRAVFWCSSKKISAKEPGQRTVFCNEVVEGMLKEIHVTVTPEMVRESLLELFELYAEVMTVAESFNHYLNPENHDQLAMCLFDEHGEFYPQDEFIFNIQPEVRSLLESNNVTLRSLHPDILKITTNKDYHWLANANDKKKVFSTLKISKDVGCKSVMKAIENLTESYRTFDGSERIANLRKLSEIVVMILRSEEQSGSSESLLSQIYGDAEMKSTFEELEWVPIGSQIGIESELCTWSEFYLPTSKFDAIWGSDRTHPIITDAEGEAFISHSHFSDVNWEWLKSVSNDIVKQSRLPETPSAKRMVFAILHDRDMNALNLQNEEIFSDAFFKHLNDNLDSSYLENLTNDNPGLEWCIPTKDSYVYNPITYGKSEEHSVLTEIFPADKKSLVTAWIQPLKELFSKLKIPSMESVEARFSAYVELCRSIGNDEVTEVQRNFMNDQLNIIATQLENDFDKIYEFLSGQIVDLDDAPQFILTCKDNVLRPDSTFFYSKGDAIEPFSELIPSLQLAGKNLGGVFSLPKGAADAIFYTLGFSGWEQLSGDEITRRSAQETFTKRVEGQSLELSQAKKWNEMVLTNTEFISSDQRITMPFAVLQGNSVSLASLIGKSVNTYRMKVNEILAMLKETNVQLVPFEHEIRLQHGDSLRLFEDIHPSIFSKISSKVVVKGKSNPIVNFSEYMHDVYTALKHISELPEHSLSHFTSELDDLAELAEMVGTTTSDRLETRYEFGGKSTSVESNKLYLCEGNQVTITQDFEQKMTQKEVLVEVFKKWLDNQGYEERKFADECVRQAKALFEWDNPIEWSEHETKLKELWKDVSPQCNGEMILSPKKKEAIDEMNSNYRDTGCNLCKKKTPNSPGSEFGFEERRVAIVKERSTRYHGIDNNSIGNMLYLCPNHAQSYSKKCVKIEFRCNSTWVDIEDLSEEDLSENPALKDIRFSVWEGVASGAGAFGGGSGKSIVWNNYELGKLVEDGRIVKVHAEKLINNLLSWIKSQEY